MLSRLERLCSEVQTSDHNQRAEFSQIVTCISDLRDQMRVDNSAVQLDYFAARFLEMEKAS